MLRIEFVHDDVDHRIVHAAIGDCLRDYHQYMVRVERFLDDREHAEHE